MRGVDPCMKNGLTVLPEGSRYLFHMNDGDAHKPGRLDMGLHHDVARYAPFV